MGSVSDIDQFKQAWDAAGRGDRATFERFKNKLGGYLLFPYLQYEDYRNRRAKVPTEEMATFLDDHQNFAFTNGLRGAWLASLARAGRWTDFVTHAKEVDNTVLKCQRAQGQIILGQTAGLLTEAQNLWVVGKSQPDECDPVFSWLIKNNGISTDLAWERIRLAMEAGNRRLTYYLARFIPEGQRRWLEYWQWLSRTGYTRLEQARDWPDNDINRMITAVSLLRLANQDAERAAEKFGALDGHYNWGESRRGELLHAIALSSAVALQADTGVHMARVPTAYRDSQLLEWWVRFLLSRQNWEQVVAVIGKMSDETRNDVRWRYWLAQAESRSGRSTATARLESLALEANYYGFLAADELAQSYNICPLQPDIEDGAIERIAGTDGFGRALELRKAGLEGWAVGEWTLAMARLRVADIKIAAALAQRERWHDRVIFALGNSGDLQFYAWRFPLAWRVEVERAAADNQLDLAWVYGTIRSESAMQETARSTVNALGLMQVTPATGRQVARKHGLGWTGSTGLKTVAGNLPIGSAYMRDLLQKHQHNPVLVSAAYNAGPEVVKRWLADRSIGEAAIWIETLPYFETRDYIPRVLAFTTLYDWRMGGEVQRISTRMPHIESGKISVMGTTEVVCRDPDDAGN